VGFVQVWTGVASKKQVCAICCSWCYSYYQHIWPEWYWVCMKWRIYSVGFSIFCINKILSNVHIFCTTLTLLNSILWPCDLLFSWLQPLDLGPPSHMAFYLITIGYGLFNRRRASYHALLSAFDNHDDPERSITTMWRDIYITYQKRS